MNINWLRAQKEVPDVLNSKCSQKEQGELGSFRFCIGFWRSMCGKRKKGWFERTNACMQDIDFFIISEKFLFDIPYAPFVSQVTWI